MKKLFHEYLIHVKLMEPCFWKRTLYGNKTWIFSYLLRRNFLKIVYFRNLFKCSSSCLDFVNIEQNIDLIFLPISIPSVIRLLPAFPILRPDIVVRSWVFKFNYLLFYCQKNNFSFLPRDSVH